MARFFTRASNQFLSAGDTPTLDIASTQISISAIISITDNTVDAHCISKWGAVAGDLQYLLSTEGNPNVVKAAIFDGGSFVFGSGSTTLSNNTVYQIGMGYDGSTMLFILDGAQDGTSSGSITIQNTTANFKIGGSDEGAGKAFGGMIAEVGVWNVGLSLSEWAMLGKRVSPLMVRTNALVGYFPLIGQFSPELDLRNGVTATLNNTPTTVAHPRVLYPRGTKQRRLTTAVSAAGFISSFRRSRGIGR